ncbi:MAG TPA: amino acid adenylation domain-containing protein, partial [Thermoanaerobaculia bacterium]
ALFEAPRLADLARRAEAARRETGAPPMVRLGRTEAPLSFAQTRLWFLDLLEPGSPTYVLPLALRLRGELSPAALTAALGEVARRHEALRTTFQERAGEPAQVISAPVPLVLPVADLAGLPAERAEAEARRLGREEAARPFDLGRGPLFRVTLLRLGAAEHVLLLDLHHIVSDGWSMGVLVREIAALYGAALAGGPSPLPELPVQYADFAVWQRSWLQGEELERQIAYWRRRLAGVPPVLELPADRLRPATPTRRTGRLLAAFGADLAGELARLAHRHEASLFMVLLAGLQALLGRVTGQDDIPVGSPVANRNRGEIEPLIGFFVNTLVLRGDVAGDPAFTELLARVRQMALEAYAHQDLPFERLVEELQPERRLSVPPLFQVLCALQNAPMDRAELRGLSLEALDVWTGVTPFDLELSFMEGRDGEPLRVLALYNADLFDPPTVLRLITHLEALFRGAVAGGGRPVSELPLFSPAERAQLVREWNDTRRDDLRELPLHRLFEAWAAAAPDALAVLAATGESLTYGELDLRAGRLASRLRGLGVGISGGGPETRVAVASGRRPHLVVGVLAVLKAGGAYVPIDPEYPAERIAMMLGDSGAAVLLAEERLRERLPKGTARFVPLDGAGLEEAPPAASAVSAEADPLAAAYVIYTSGSTGRPKGVVVPHRAISRYVQIMIEMCGFAPGDRVLQFSSPSFDTSVEEIWCALGSGAALVLRSSEAAGSIPLFVDELERQGVTAASLPTAFWHEIAAALGEGSAALSPAFRLLIIGGEEAQAHRLAAWNRGTGGRVRLLSSYGPTETTVASTYSSLGRWEEGEPEPLGRPIADIRHYVVDHGLGLVPAGVWGDLLVGGSGVARGYLGRPDLTAERFLPDAWSGEPGARVYRSGDLVRLRRDGDLQFGGRIDLQIKVRGFRVEPGEVEDALGTCPGVRDAAVVASLTPTGNSLLACVVAADPADAPTPAGLRAFLAERLPAHLVPAAFAVLPRLPLTPNGKVDRRALERLRPDGAEGDEKSVSVPPRTPVEEWIARIWKEILGVETVGRNDNFFALGGHSLAATRLVSRLKSALGADVPLQAVFEAPTLADLAFRFVEPALGARVFSSRGPVRLAWGEERAAPLSFAQERFWFLDRLQPGNAAYNIPTALRVEGELSQALLEAILGEVVRRHEALRTSFEERAGYPVQVIAPPDRWGMPLADLSGLPEEARLAEARRLASAEAAWPFDLARGRLLRAVLLRLAAAEHALLLTMHHIVSDGWSMGVLVHEIVALYVAALAGRPSPLPELPLQYVDFAVWQRGWLAGEELERQLSYWRRRLDGAPVSLDLPVDRPRPAVPTYRGSRVHAVLGPETLDELKRFSLRHEATLFMVVLATFQALLRRLTGQEDIQVGSPIANRNREEIEPLIGFFVNTLVLRGDLTGDPPFRELLARVRRATLEAYDHQDLPFELLVEKLRPQRHLSANPLFQVICAVQNTPSESMDLEGLSFAPLEFDLPFAQFDFELNVWEVERSLALSFTHSSELFDATTAQRIAGLLETLLRGVLADDGRRLSGLPLLPAAARHQLVVEWNDTGVPEAPPSVVERFAAQVAAAPHALALEAGGERLTYAELDRRANRLAHRLRRLGVGPEVAVGLFAERSAAMVAGLLGIWKAGGAYLPLDPAHPPARLAYLLEDSQVPVIAAGVGLADALPLNSARIVRLDDEDLVGESDRPPAGLPGPGDLAYLIYTSGTTGRPKAVLVEHGNLAATLAAVQAAFGFGPDDRMPCIASFTFDIFLFELLGPLLAGGTSVLLPLRPTLDLDRLVGELGAATLLHAVPAVMRQILEVVRRRGAAAPRLRALFTGGDAVPADLLADLRAAFPGAAVWELYGPTETAIVCTAWPVPAGGPERSLLGRPFAGAEIHVRDADGNPVPIGVPGEIWIGGSGVTRGYWRRGDLTAERFAPAAGRRAFRSGDRARRLPDGNLEFLGRDDQQVKVRGFRIELGEVEAALLRRPEVEEAVVTPRELTPGAGRQLVAYVVPRADAGGAEPPEEESEHVAQWRTLYDVTYGKSAAVDPTFDTEGWNSTYTGLPIPAAEMREWVDGTVERVLALHPRRVLEVGCGTGLLLFRVAPRCELYRATDFSPVALDGLRRRMDEAGLGLPQVELVEARADDWNGVAPGSFDLVILNSVVQYFPDVHYLLHVLEGAARALRPGGAIFVGDVRNLELLDALHVSVELFRAPDSQSAAELRRRVRRRVADEEELLLAPGFFPAVAAALPELGGAALLPKQGSHLNELTRFRYDAILFARFADTGAPVPGAETAGSLTRVMKSRLPAETAAALSLLPDADEELPEPPATRRPWSAYANAPLRGKRARRLASELRRALQAELPDYMVPAHIVVLDALPLTPHGKVDRAALPEPDLQVGGSGEPPRTPAEAAMAGLWREVLGLDEVGREDDFFELGGHSLLATQLVARAREAFGVEVPLRAIFDTPTVAALAAWIEPAFRPAGEPDDSAPAAAARPATAPPPLVPRPAGEAAPLSFGQERLWFLDRLEPGNTAFNMGSSLRLRGRLDARALERALNEVLRRHEALRVSFAEIDGRPVQRTAPVQRLPLPVLDLSRLPGPAREAEAERVAQASLASPFDLETGPLVRASLLRLAPDLHLFVLEIHHIVSDGWSAAVMDRELIALYDAFAAGRPSPLPPLPIQYGDFARWQREWLRGEALEAQLAYWRGKLGGSLEPLDLPTDRPRPAVQTFRGGSLPFEIPAATGRALQALSRQQGASLFMTLLAAFQALLSRLSGQEEIVVGSPIAGRRHVETEGLIGFFLNTLALRTDLGGDPTFRELLDRVRETTLGAYEHQDIPFEALLAELRPERDLSRTPVFQVFFNMLNLPSEEVRLADLEIGWGPAAEPEAKFDLTLYLSERAGTVTANLVYNADLFDAARMEELLRQYRTVLERAALEPDVRVREISLVTAEGAAILPDPLQPLGAEWRGAVHELFLAEARRHPERLAVTDPQGSWSYGELADAAGRLAAHLRAAGLEPGDRVAIWAHRSAPVAWAVMATLAAGGAFVMLDPAYPAARLVEILRLAAPQAWLALADAGAVPGEVEALLAGWEAEGRLLGRAVLPGGGPVSAGVADLLAALPSPMEPVATGPTDLAFVAFTSGSTGVPKGILGLHGPLSHFLPWQRERFGLDREDRYSLLSGLAHDPLQRDLFTALCTGATLCAPDPEEIFVPGRLAAWAARQGITIAHLTPAMGQVLTEPPGDGSAPTSIPSLRYVLLVGDVLTRLDVDRLRRLAPAVACVNLYGSTETQRAVGYHVVEPDAGAAGQRSRQVLPLGRGMEDVQILIVNAETRLAGVGEVGEIWMRSPHLARGYLGDAALTRERFLVNPFTGEEGDRVYRTGDLGRYLPNGEAVFAGRADQQVKIRGFRIETGEIQAAIGRLDGVRESVVVLREERGERYLAAYVVPEPGAEPGIAGRLRPFLASRLPDYMVPAAFVELPALPLTPNGKIDRRALPAPQRQATAAGAAPRNPVEERLAGLWADLLRLDRVGVHDNFFELGGHSLLAIQLVSRVRGAFRVELPLRTIFEASTIADLAAWIERAQQAAGEHSAAPPILPVRRDRPLPLSFAQERLWFLYLLAPESPVYNMTTAVRLAGRLDVGALAAALSEVLRRHEALRTTFRTTATGAVQGIHPWSPPPHPLIDLSGLPAETREAEARGIAAEEGSRPFDLERGPLLRALLLRLADENHVALWSTHHISSDAWSLNEVLVPELIRLYAAYAQGRPSPLPGLPVQYADYAVWQREWLRGAVLEEQIGYWRRQLAGLTPLELPADRPRPPAPSGRGGSRAWELPAGGVESLSRLARQGDATLFMALFAAFAALLHKETEAAEVPVGMPVASRSRSEIEGLIGFFVNTLVLRGELAGDPDLPALLARSRGTVLGALSHQDLPFERLVDELGLPRNPHRPPLLRVVFQLQTTLQAASAAAGGGPVLSLAPFEATAEAAKFDLVVHLFETAGEVGGFFRYDADLFDDSTIARLAGHFTILLAAWTGEPGLPLSQVPLLSPAERHQLLVEWNPAAAVDRERMGLHRRFEAQVDRAPEALAVSVGGESLTYGELDRRANRLARHLRAAGARPGDRVALLL